jgi:hypothetical protein
MNSNLVFPLFAMFLLTSLVLGWMFYTRVRSIKSGAVKINFFKVYDQLGGPPEMLQASRHFSNLFEVPVLFYLVCVLGILFAEGSAFLILAWLFVGARVAHTIVHLSSNQVILRMRFYGTSWLILAAMWLQLVYHLLVNR